MTEGLPLRLTFDGKGSLPVWRGTAYCQGFFMAQLVAKRNSGCTVVDKNARIRYILSNAKYVNVTIERSCA